MMNVVRIRNAAIIAAAGVLAGVFVGRVGLRAAQALAAPGGPPSAAAMRAEYDASTVRISGRLAAPALASLAASGPAGAGRTWTLVLLRGRDLAGCEDLGRQLREVQHRGERGSGIVVWTLTADREAVQRFLRRERLKAAVLATSSLEALGLEPVPLVTPAVLRVRQPDGWAEGVGHTRRFKNVRTRSFADEMADAGAGPDVS